MMKKYTEAFTSVSPATYQQYVKLLIERLAAEQLPELAGVICVQGKWLAPEQSSGKYIYGAKISDDGGAQVKVDIPTSIVTSRGIHPGQLVTITGCINIRSSNYGVEVRLNATDIKPSELHEDNKLQNHEDRLTLERLKALPVTRNIFPHEFPIKIALIRSASTLAQVTMDCRSELDQLGDAVDVREIPINMLDPVAIAATIESITDAGILMLIRGGGDNLDFSVFDDHRVLSALARHTAHRVIGLGHTANTTLLDKIADYTANTPAQAGVYVKNKAMSQIQEQIGNQAIKTKLDRLYQQNLLITAQLREAKQKNALRTIAIAIIASIVTVITTYIAK